MPKSGYWNATRAPRYSLTFALPLLVAYEVLATPFTYWVVNTLKRVEGVDVYDRETRLKLFGG